MATQHGLSGRDLYIALPDGKLIEQLYGVICTLPNEGTDVERAYDVLYFLVDELLERFLPNLAVAETERYYRDPRWYDEDPIGSEENLADALAEIRRRQATRLLRDAFDGGNNA